MEEDISNITNNSATQKDIKSYLEMMKESHSSMIMTFISKTNTFYNQLSSKLIDFDDSTLNNNEQLIDLLEKNKVHQNSLQLFLNAYCSELNKLFSNIDQLVNDYPKNEENDNIQLIDPIYKHSITSEENIERDISILTKHKTTLNEIELTNITQYHNYYLTSIIPFNNLERITISNGTWDPTSETSTSQMSYKSHQSKAYYPKLKAIIINNTRFIKSKSILSFPLILSLQVQTVPSIQILKFEKVDLIDTEFNHIVNHIILNANIMKSLQVLSFEDNSITVINFKTKMSIVNEDLSKENSQFDELRELNLKDNKIFQFQFDYDSFPRITLINLINNRVSMESDIDFPNAKKNTSILFLCNKNIILTVQHILSDYNQQLTKVLSQYDYPMSYMSFEGLFNNNNQISFQGIKLNETSFASLKELSIANCGLSSESLMNFFNNNKSIMNLEYLVLNNNMLTMSFFNLYLNYVNDKNVDGIILKELRHLDLSCNLIEDGSFSSMNDFVILHQKLTELKLELNPFCVNYKIDKSSKLKERENNNLKINEMNNVIESQSNNSNNNEKCDLIDFSLFFNQMYLSKRDLSIDFSTESRIIKNSILKEKNYQVKVKKKKI